MHIVGLASVKCKSNDNLASVVFEENIISVKNKETYVCKFCNKEYIHRQNMYKHVKKCPIRIENLVNLKKVKLVIEKIEKIENNESNMVENLKKSSGKHKKISKISKMKLWI